MRADPTEELLDGLKKDKLDASAMEQIEATVKLAKESHQQSHDLEYKLSGKLQVPAGSVGCHADLDALTCIASTGRGERRLGRKRVHRGDEDEEVALSAATAR